MIGQKVDTKKQWRSDTLAPIVGEAFGESSEPLFINKRRPAERRILSEDASGERATQARAEKDLRARAPLKPVAATDEPREDRGERSAQPGQPSARPTSPQ